MCWYRRPNQTYMFVFTLLRTKCTTPNDEYIYMDEKTQRIRWITDLNTLKSCEPDMSKHFNIVTMTDMLHKFLEPKFHDPQRGPNLKENGYVEEVTVGRDRRKPEPPSPPNYKAPETRRSKESETSSDRGGRTGRGAKRGRGGRGGRGGKSTGKSDPKPPPSPVAASVTRGKRTKESKEVVSDMNEELDDDNLSKKAKFEEEAINLTNKLNSLNSRLESMSSQHSKEIERLEEIRRSDIAALLEKQAIMEREIESYKTKAVTAAAPPKSPPMMPAHVDAPPMMSTHVAAPPLTSHIAAPPMTPDQVVPPQSTLHHVASSQIMPQHIASQPGLSLTQYVANLRSLTMRGEEHNLLLNMLRERDILESSIATFGNLTFPLSK